MIEGIERRGDERPKGTRDAPLAAIPILLRRRLAIPEIRTSQPLGVQLAALARAASRISRHRSATCSRSVGSAPIETRTIQRPSRIAGVR